MELASAGGLGRHVDAARRALEQLERSIQGSVASLPENEREDLGEAIAELGGLVDELQIAQARSQEAAAEAARDRRRFRELFELAPDGYLTTDEHGVIRHANRAAAEMLGTPQRWLVGKPLVLFLEREDGPELHRRLPKVLDEGGPHEWEVTVRPRRSHPFPALIRCSAGSGDAQPLLRILLHDLTHEREGEARRRAELEEHSQEVEALERAKSHFLRLASHELRGPLAVIRGYVGLLRDGSLGDMPEAAGSVLPTLEQKVVEMAGMVDELLDTARIEEGRLDLRIENVELTRLVAGVVEGVRPLLSERHRLAVRPGSPVVVLADPRRARTIVANLVDNAVKYSPDGGVVEIAVKVREQHGVVEVADQGIGISDEQLKTMFQPFGRVVTSETSSIGGTGLGLHLSRELARLQDGDLELTSQPGAGTTARLLLPLDSLQAGQAGIG